MQQINRNQYQFFPFHLVTPSPWPLLLSFTLLGVTISAVLSIHGYPNGTPLLNLSLLLTVIGMALWFNDVIAEGTYKGDHTKKVQNGLSLGFLLFVVSEVFVFLSVFWGFFHSSLTPSIEIATWPPRGIESLDVFAIPFINTMLLLSSGAFITYGHHALIHGNRKGAIVATAITILLAAVFTALQYVEYLQAGFTMSDSVFGSVFYASTGLHGLHVLVGTIFIVVQLVRMTQYHLTDKHHQGHEAAIYYWHFVDVVWIFLFLVVYYWSGT